MQFRNVCRAGSELTTSQTGSVLHHVVILARDQPLRGVHGEENICTKLIWLVKEQGVAAEFGNPERLKFISCCGDESAREMAGWCKPCADTA